MSEVDLIPKEYKKKKDKLLVFFPKIGGIILVLLILSLLFYGGLLLYENSLNKSLDKINEEIRIIDRERDLETEEKLINLDRKLGVLQDLFKNHVYWSKFFSKIEELTIPQAYFPQVSFVISGGSIKVNLSGNTLSYTTLAKQMVSFQEESSVEGVSVSGIALSNEGGVNFKLKVNFSKNVLLNHD